MFFAFLGVFLFLNVTETLNMSHVLLTDCIVTQSMSRKKNIMTVSYHREHYNSCPYLAQDAYSVVNIKYMQLSSLLERV